MNGCVLQHAICKGAALEFDHYGACDEPDLEAVEAEEEVCSIELVRGPTVGLRLGLVEFDLGFSTTRPGRIWQTVEP